MKRCVDCKGKEIELYDRLVYIESGKLQMGTVWEISEYKEYNESGNLEETSFGVTIRHARMFNCIYNPEECLCIKD